MQYCLHLAFQIVLTHGIRVSFTLLDVQIESCVFLPKSLVFETACMTLSIYAKLILLYVIVDCWLLCFIYCIELKSASKKSRCQQGGQCAARVSGSYRVPIVPPTAYTRTQQLGPQGGATQPLGRRLFPSQPGIAHIKFLHCNIVHTSVTRGCYTSEAFLPTLPKDILHSKINSRHQLNYQ